MKVVADSRGRLAAMPYFKPGKAFEISPLPDGALRIVELVERRVPTVKVKFNANGDFKCPRLMSRREIARFIRADRDAR